MMTMGLLPEHKINKPAVAMGFAAQVVFVVVRIQLGYVQPKKIVFAANLPKRLAVVPKPVVQTGAFTPAVEKPTITKPVAAAQVQTGGYSRPTAEPVEGTGSPVEIISKPRPDYTEDGRKHGIEGDVTLEVTSTSAGQIPVVRVVRGLGYGLAEQAIRAAQQIRFKPARLGGRPIDSRAVVHIIFELVS